MVSDNAGEQYAEFASCSDHSGDVNKMVPAGLPSEEIRRIIDDAMNSAIPETWEVIAHATARLEALFAPILAEKEREIERYEAMIKHEQDAAIHWYNEAAKFNDRALAAEAALAAGVEALKGSQAAIRDLRTQGAPTAYWDDVEAANLAALAQIAAPGAAMEAP